MIEQCLFPVDIYSVKKYGVAKWQDEFFWPVADKEFAALCADLDRMFCEYIEAAPREISDLLLLQRNSVLEYWHFLHAVKVLDEVRRRGLRPFYSDRSLWYKAILDGTLLEKAMGFSGKRTGLYEQYKQDGWRIVKTNAAMRVRSVYYNFTLGKLRQRNNEGGGAVIFGTPDALHRQYMKSLPGWVTISSPYDWIWKRYAWIWRKEAAQRPARPAEERQGYQLIAQEIVGRIKSIAQSHQIFLRDEQVNYLRQFTIHQLGQARELLTIVEQVLEAGRGINHLLLTVATSLLQRAAAITVRKRGGKVTAFTHGGHIGIFPSPTVAKNEFALADEFVTYTKGSVALFERMLLIEKPLRNNKVTLIAGGGDIYLRIWGHFQRQPLPPRIRTVMLVGFPYNTWRRPYGAASLALMNLDLELRLVRFLKAEGYRIIYKAHPDRWQEESGVFDGLAEVLVKPFENVLEHADAFIFGCIRTTTFPVALATNKPVIVCMMHDENPPLFPDVRLLLEKRCAFVRLDFDGRNRVMFDDGALINALSVSPLPPNTEFLEQYLLP